MTGGNQAQEGLDTYQSDAEDTETSRIGTDSEETIEILADESEQESELVKDLVEREEVALRIESRPEADYVLSDRVGIRYVRLEGFGDGDAGERLREQVFTQLDRFGRSHACPLVVLEGEGDEEALSAMEFHRLRAVAINDHEVSLMETRDRRDTGELFVLIAQREQTPNTRTRSLHEEKHGKRLAEQQEYVIQSIAELGPVTAQTLLEEFSSVENVMSASREELMETPGIGKQTATQIWNIVTTSYSRGDAPSADSDS